ncbi:hypothetical protein [Niallia taxi]|uniref:hypothetical protein n=1 Tax=Niallia taxi TaxID=2499688 RepID=UPI0015F55CD3|nr:hypothetical protein [Niallia taxi]
MKYNVEENKVTGFKNIYVNLEDGETPQKVVPEILEETQNDGPAFVIVYRDNSDVITKYHAYKNCFKLENEGGTKGLWRDGEGNHLSYVDVDQEKIEL